MFYFVTLCHVLLPIVEADADEAKDGADNSNVGSVEHLTEMGPSGEPNGVTLCYVCYVMLCYVAELQQDCYASVTRVLE
jgi:hypothetical protein